MKFSEIPSPNAAQKSLQRFLTMEIPVSVREAYAEEYDIALDPGSTYGVLLRKRVDQLAQNDPAFAELAHFADWLTL